MNDDGAFQAWYDSRQGHFNELSVRNVALCAWREALHRNKNELWILRHRVADLEEKTKQFLTELCNKPTK